MSCSEKAEVLVSETPRCDAMEHGEEFDGLISAWVRGRLLGGMTAARSRLVGLTMLTPHAASRPTVTRKVTERELHRRPFCCDCQQMARLEQRLAPLELELEESKHRRQPRRCRTRARRVGFWSRTCQRPDKITGEQEDDMSACLVLVIGFAMCRVRSGGV